MTRTTFLRGAFAGLMGVVGVIVIGFAVFAASLPRVETDPARLNALAGDLPATDRGIVALTGGAGARIERALAMQAAGVGDRVLISGVNPSIRKADLSGTGSAGQLDCCVDLGPFARTTRGNALEARAWAESHGYQVVYLVTSNFHLPRARAEMERSAPGLTIIGVAVDSNLVPDGRWGRSPRAWRTLGGEYAKLIVAHVRGLA